MLLNLEYEGQSLNSESYLPFYRRKDAFKGKGSLVQVQLLAFFKPPFLVSTAAGSQYILYFKGILFFSLPRKPTACLRNFTDRLNKVIHRRFHFPTIFKYKAIFYVL
jgi:hypothetical protein